VEARAGECRPRVAGAREEEILDATLTQLLEVGYDRLTMDQVAERAHASKATLYRRWTGKQTLVVDALTRSHRAVDMPRPDTGSLRGDLVALFTGPGGLASQLSTKIAVVAEIYRRAAERGELKADVDLSLLGPALPGILLHRALLLGEPITPQLVERVVDQIILPAATGCPTCQPSPTSQETA
jgi:AcrR family transcriptional regulator